MRKSIYEVLGVAFLLGSGFFFYRSVEFLAQADYVGGFLVIVIGFLVVRAGVDLSRLSVAMERE